MSYATMQRQVLASMPGLPLQLAGNFLQSSYEELCRKWEWAGLEETFRLTTFTSLTTSDNNGWVTIDQGSKTVTGITDGTDTPAWATDLDLGTSALDADLLYYFKPGSGRHFHEISQVNDETTLTLRSTYTGSTIEADDETSYEIFKHIYPLSPDEINQYETVRDLLSIRHERDLTERQAVELDRMDPEREMTGDPTHYAKRGFTTTGVPLIEIWPRPTTTTTLTYRARINPGALASGAPVRIDENLIVHLALINLVPAYQIIKPEQAKILANNYRIWTDTYNDLYGGLVTADVSRHSTARKTRKASGGGAGRVYFGDDITNYDEYIS